jgi:hypothetical protein
VAEGESAVTEEDRVKLVAENQRLKWELQRTRLFIAQMRLIIEDTHVGLHRAYTTLSFLHGIIGRIERIGVFKHGPHDDADITDHRAEQETHT